MKKRVLSIALVLSLTAVMLSGCGSSSGDADTLSVSEAATVSSDDVFNVAITSTISTLDPIQCNDFSSELIINNMFDTLVKFSDDGAEIEPCIAVEWSTPDDLTYVFTIREGVQFWDGNELTAEDVAYSMLRHMDAENASLFGYLYTGVDSIEATGDYEVTVTLASPDSTFLSKMAMMSTAIVEKSYAEEAGSTFGTIDGGLMGTGPFVYESWTDGSSIVMQKNENYWNTETEYAFETLEFDFMSDEASVAVAMTSGQIDFFNFPSNDIKEELTASGTVDVDYAEGLENAVLYFNCSTGPFSDPYVRKAVACAVDEEAIAASIQGEGYYTSAGSLDFDPEIMKYDTENWVALASDLDSYSYDLEQAKEYLAQSSYPDGFTCKILNTASLSNKVTQAVQSYLKELNIEVEIETIQTDDYFSAAYGAVLDDEGYRDYDMMYMVWFPDYTDPESFLQLYYGPNSDVGGANMSAYTNDEFDTLFEEQSQLSDSERSEALMSLYTMLNEDCASKQLAYFGATWSINSAYTTELGCMWMWNYDFTQVTLK